MYSSNTNQQQDGRRQAPNFTLDPKGGNFVLHIADVITDSGRSGLAIYSAVSYTHLDVYKRQGLTGPDAGLKPALVRHPLRLVRQQQIQWRCDQGLSLIHILRSVVIGSLVGLG